MGPRSVWVLSRVTPYLSSGHVPVCVSMTFRVQGRGDGVSTIVHGCVSTHGNPLGRNDPSSKTGRDEVVVGPGGYFGTSRGMVGEVSDVCVTPGPGPTRIPKNLCVEGLYTSHEDQLRHSVPLDCVGHRTP